MNIRLEQFMQAEKLNSAKLAEILEIQPSSISHLLSGRNKPSFDFISKLMTMFPELNPDWIINGNGVMYRSENGDNDAQPKNVTKLNNSLYDNDNYIENQKDTKVNDVNTIDFNEPVLPLFDPTPVVEVKNESQVEKIIILYADNTFEIALKRK